MKELIDYALKNGFLLHPTALSYLQQMEGPLDILKQLKSQNQDILFLDRNLIEHYLKQGRKDEATLEKKVVKFEHDLKIVFDITGNSTCEGELSDFHQYFLNRYEKLHRLLKQRKEMAAAVPINRVGLTLGDTALIGMVSNIRETKNGRKIITVEDKTGSIDLFFNENTHCPHPVLNDEVIGVVGRPSQDGERLHVDEIIHPDVPYRGRKQNRASGNVAVAFVSDTHFGSNTFLKKEWDRFLCWLNGDGDYTREERELAKKIKYIVMPGDLVDGIGIYPNQDKELEILDIYEQYKFAAEELDRVPEDIKIIIQPGNHDAVRMAEPQPALPEKIQKLFKRKNVVFTGNPSEFLLEGVRVLSYHGKSMNDFDRAVKEFKIKDPMPIMKSMLKRRHLVPMYGASTQLAPEHEDYLVIEDIPDIFVTGHVHSAGHSIYKGVLLINASCWQAQTEYQKMMNFVPDPAKVPVVNLRDFRVNILNFSKTS